MADDPGADAPADKPDDQPPAPSGEPATTEAGDDWRKKYDTALAESRKWEQRAKANNDARKELDELKKQSMTDVEKAVAEAKAQATVEATRTFGERLASAHIETALTGVVPDPVAIIEDLNLSKFVTDDGDPDVKAIAKLRAKYEAHGAVKKPPPGVPAGPQGNSAPAGMNQTVRSAFGRT